MVKVHLNDSVAALSPDRALRGSQTDIQVTYASMLFPAHPLLLNQSQRERDRQRQREST